MNFSNGGTNHEQKFLQKEQTHKGRALRHLDIWDERPWYNIQGEAGEGINGIVLAGDADD